MFSSVAALLKPTSTKPAESMTVLALAASAASPEPARTPSKLVYNAYKKAGIRQYVVDGDLRDRHVLATQRQHERTLGALQNRHAAFLNAFGKRYIERNQADRKFIATDPTNFAMHKAELEAREKVFKDSDDGYLKDIKDINETFNNDIAAITNEFDKIHRDIKIEAEQNKNTYAAALVVARAEYNQALRIAADQKRSAYGELPAAKRRNLDKKNLGE